MAKTFTDEEIKEILELVQRDKHTQYIGARYVPIFGRKGETTVEWDNKAPYEPLTIVLHQGNSYTSRQYVPTGIDITNTDFWAETGNYNAQIEQYRKEMGDKLDKVAHDGTVKGSGTTTDPLKVNLNHTATNNDTGNTVYPALAKNKDTGEINGIAFNAGDGLTAYNSDDIDVGSGIRLADDVKNTIENSKNWITEHEPDIAYARLSSDTNNATQYSEERLKTNKSLTHQKRTFGQYHNACVASFMANETEDNPKPQIMGGTTIDIAKNYTDRDSVAIYASTSFYPQTTYTADHCTYNEKYVVVDNYVANTAKPGMFIDAFTGTPTPNGAWSVAKISGITGNTLFVDGWYQQRNDGKTIKKIPDNVDLHVNYQSKIWGENIVVNNPDGKPSCGFELGCILAESSHADTSGFDVVTLSGKGSSAYRARGAWDCMFDARQSNNDTLLAFATKLTNVNVGGEIRNAHIAIVTTQTSATIDENAVAVFTSGTNSNVNLTIKAAHVGKMMIIKNYKSDAIKINNTITLNGGEGHLYIYDGSTWLSAI